MDGGGGGDEHLRLERDPLAHAGGHGEARHVGQRVDRDDGEDGGAVLLRAFGEAAASVQVYVLVTMNVSTFTMGLLLANAGDGKPGSHWRALLSTLRQPAIYAVATAACCKAMDLHPEHIRWLWEPLKMMAEALVGIALLLFSVQRPLWFRC